MRTTSRIAATLLCVTGASAGCREEAPGTAPIRYETTLRGREKAVHKLRNRNAMILLSQP